MSSLRLNFLTIRTAALAAVGVTALAGLSACEERPYSVPVKSAAYVPPRSHDLAGAPAAAYVAPPPAYVAPAPAYVAPPPPPAPTYVEPAPTYAETPPAPAYAPPAQAYRAAPAYDTGGQMIVAMAPIPNPPEGHYGRRGYAPPPAADYGSEAPPPRVVHHYAARPAYAPAPKTPYAAPKGPSYAAAPAAPKTYAAAAPPVKTTVTTVEKKVATATTHAAVATTTAAADAANSAKLAAAKTAEAAKAAAPVAAAKLAQAADKAKAAVKTAAAPPATSGDRTTKLAALQSALTDAVSKNAVLTTPARFTANQPADVSLTLPAQFAETMRKEADKQGLSDAAASVNMTAALAGEGFSVTPDDSQSQPLTVGQPTEFHWTVTATQGAKGPLHADVGANLLGGDGDTLSLGTVQKNAGMQLKMTPKMLGAGILALIVILVLGWLARGRNTPSRSSAARRAGRRARGAGYNRPLDMATETGDSH